MKEKLKFLEALHEYRMKHELTIKELAERTGMSLPSHSCYDRRVRLPTPLTMAKIRNALGEPIGKEDNDPS